MSDPVIKAVKRSSSRPAPQSATTKSSAKDRKETTKSAQPKPLEKRSAAEKAPVRKATPAKTAAGSSGKGGKAPKRPQVAGKAASGGKSRAAAPVTAKKSTQTAAKTPAPKSTPAPAAKARPASKPGAANAATARPAAPARTPAAAPKQPSRDEAAALRAFEQAHREFVAGRFAEARTQFRALIEHHSGVAEVTARARTYLAVAESRLRTESSLPRDAESLYDRGVIELNRGDYVAAQELFERAIKREPESADIHYALAATRARLGSIEFALQSLERALNLRQSLRVRAQNDPDLAILRNEQDFERLVFPSRS